MRKLTTIALAAGLATFAFSASAEQTSTQQPPPPPGPYHSGPGGWGPGPWGPGYGQPPQQAQQNAHLLAVLAGRAPGAGPLPAFSLEDFTLPAELPLR